MIDTLTRPPEVVASPIPVFREDCATSLTSKPTVRDVRAHLPETSRSKSIALGLILFVISAVMYAATFAAILLLAGWPAKFMAACLNSLFIATLFVVGHDACHGSLTPVAWINKIIGRLSFLPSLHPYTAWEHSHNGLHHGWSNLRGKDPVYAPFTKGEFDRLPRYRRALERVYRTPVGLGLFYLFEIWWKYEICPGKARGPKGKRRVVFECDRLLVLCFLGFQLLATVLLMKGAPFRAVLPLSLLVAVVLPFAIWKN